MRRWDWPSIILAIVGLAFLALAGLFGIVVPATLLGDAARAERLAPVSAAALEDSQPGREVLVEGRVSERNQPRFRDFVAYVSEEYRGSDDDGDSIWATEERVLPRLWIAVGDSLVRVANESYSVIDEPAVWQDSQVLSWESGTRTGTLRYRGFRAGDPAVMIGTVVAGSEGAEVAIEFLAGGTRAEYISRRQGAASAFRWVGLALGVVGLILALIWARLRGRRDTPRAPRRSRPARR